MTGHMDTRIPIDSIAGLARPEELCQHWYRPNDDEYQKSCEDVPKARRTRRVLGMQIDLNGVIKHQDIEEKQGAGEPRKMRIEEGRRLRETLGCKPIVFVWQINPLWRENRNHLWYRESNHRNHDAYNHQNSEERRLGLPAIGNATRVKVRGHHPG